MLTGKAANRALPERESAKPGEANTDTFFTTYYHNKKNLQSSQLQIFPATYKLNSCEKDSYPICGLCLSYS